MNITEKALQETEYIDKISITPVNKNNVEAELSKSMVLDPGWFDGDRMKFEN